MISGELRLVGVAYAERERMTVGTWNLQWIAIAPEHQRQGHGTTLLEHVERELANSGAHQLLIETSASLTGSQAFYRDCGYQEEGRIRDFYEVGADKIVFRKVIDRKVKTASPAKVTAQVDRGHRTATFFVGPMQHHHLDAVAQLLCTQLEDHGIAVNADDSSAVLKRIIAEPRHGFVLAATAPDGTVVGVALCSSFLGVEHGGESGWLEELFVGPEYRRCGVGSRLLGEAIKAARERGWMALDLEVDSEHSRVIRLYARHGFMPLPRSRMVLSLRRSARLLKR